MAWKSIRNKLIATAVALAVVLAIFPYLWTGRMHRQALEKARGLGIKTIMAELAPSEIPDAENASLILADIQQYAEDAQLERQFKQDDSVIFLDKTPDRAQFTQDELKRLQAILDANRPAMERLDQALILEHARFNADYGNPVPYALDVPNFLVRQTMAKMLRARAVLAANRGDWESAWRDAAGILRLSRFCMEEEPVLIVALIGFNLTEMGSWTINHLIAQSPPGDTETKRILDEIERFDVYGQTALALNFEFASFNQTMEAFLEGDVMDLGGIMGQRDGFRGYRNWLLRHPGRFVVRANQAAMLNAASELKPWLDRPSHAWDGSLNPDGLVPDWAVLAKSVTPNLRSVLLRRDLTVARVDFIRMAFALEEYKSAKGRPPSELEALAPQWLNAIPADPFDGKPYRYQGSPDGYQLHSIGADFKDDAGRPAEPGRSMIEDGDPAWRVGWG